MDPYLDPGGRNATDPQHWNKALTLDIGESGQLPGVDIVQLLQRTGVEHLNKQLY